MTDPITKTVLDWGYEAAQATGHFIKIGWQTLSEKVSSLGYKIKITALSIFRTLQILSGAKPKFVSKQIEKIQALYKPNPPAPLLALPPKTFAPEVTFQEGGKVGITRTSPPAKRAVFEGGGAKGLLYGPFFETLNKELDLIKSLEEVAGTSAGALMAFMVAAGVSPKEIEKQSCMNLMEQLQGEPVLDVLYGENGLFSANNLTRRLLESTRKEAHEYMQTITPLEWAKIENEPPTEFAGFKERAVNGFQEGLTFSDLRLLHILNPEKFKRLHVPAFNNQTKTAVYFDDKNTPEAFCHIAVRASIAIPFVFRPVVYKNEILHDGGLETNKPLRVFADKPQEETILFVFDKKGKSHKILHSPANFGSSLFHEILRSPIEKTAAAVRNAFQTGSLTTPEQENKEKWHGNKASTFKALYVGATYWENQLKDAELMYNLGPNVFVIPHSLSTLSFNAKASKIEANKKEAIIVAKVYADIRAGMLINQEYNSVELALASLTKEEKQLICELSNEEIEHRVTQGVEACKQALENAKEVLENAKSPAEALPEVAMKNNIEIAALQLTTWETRLKTLLANQERKRDFYKEIRKDIS